MNIKQDHPLNLTFSFQIMHIQIMLNCKLVTLTAISPIISQLVVVVMVGGCCQGKFPRPYVINSMPIFYITLHASQITHGQFQCEIPTLYPMHNSELQS